PARILQALGFECDDFLMGFTKVGRFQCFANTLETGVEDVEAARHGCYHNDKNPVHSMAKTLIRHAVREDFETLLEIDEASFPGGVAYDADELSYFMTRDGAETIVAEEDGEIVAFIIMEVHRTRRTGTVITLDVREAYRRSGYGTKLLQRGEEMLVDYGDELWDLQLEVKNRSAIRCDQTHACNVVPS